MTTTAPGWTIRPLADAAPQHWRNGGGTTRELLAWPDPAAWLLRVSVAEITQPGPFSAFPGIDRWFAVLEGDGVVLAGERLRADGRVIRFDGADAPDCTLPGGPTRDLNLMIRRDRAAGRLLRLAPGERWVSDAPLRGVYTLAAGRLDAPGAPPQALPAQALVFRPDARPGEAWCLAGPAFAFTCTPFGDTPP